MWRSTSQGLISKHAAQRERKREVCFMGILLIPSFGRARTAITVCLLQIDESLLGVFLFLILSVLV